MRFLQFERVTFAYPGMAEPLLADVTAHFPEGTWTGIVGANGLGKSTLVRKIVACANVPPEKLLVVPQEIDEEESRAIHADVKRLERGPLGRVMTLISRLGSRPGRLLASTTPSPGEIRKILLARGVERGPHLIVMDEPTNHLDLPSIECLEDALAEAPCALLLVSHDERFLSRLSTIRWVLSQEGDVVRLGAIAGAVD